MNNDIKEILECLKKEDNYWSKQEHNYAFPDYYSLNREDLHLLLDYITNLQQIKNNLTTSLNKKIEEGINLQQENEELKKNQRYYKNGVFSLEYDKETMSDMIDDYKSRCEKAVEYLKNNCYIGNCINTYEAIDITNVMNILNDRSDE